MVTFEALQTIILFGTLVATVIGVALSNSKKK
ncbi:putative holin-like toxin [Pontibacillus sp. ALD_SL1]|nr:putative holin-like toxin [Pontibacillus sp. ALD_SL1]